MPTALEPIALAALAPLIVLALYMGLRAIRQIARRGRSGPEGAPASSDHHAGSLAPPPRPVDRWPSDVPGSESWVSSDPPMPERMQVRPEPAPRFELVAPAAVAGVPSSTSIPGRKVDLQLARRYARPATASWKGWWGRWSRQATSEDVEPAWLQAIVESFLQLSRPIVREMIPSPESPDLDAAAAAARAIYLHPERYVMIDDRWYILESVEPKVGSIDDPSAPRWQMAPAASSSGAGAAGRHRLIPPTFRLPLKEPPEGIATSEVMFALALEGLVETGGMSRRSAARLCLSWTGLQDIADDQASETAAEAERVCHALGVTD